MMPPGCGRLSVDRNWDRDSSHAGSGRKELQIRPALRSWPKGLPGADFPDDAGGMSFDTFAAALLFSMVMGIDALTQ